MPRSTIFAAFRRALPGLVCDIAGLAGAASLSFGCWMIFPPAGYIVAGLLLMTGALIFGRKIEAGRA